MLSQLNSPWMYAVCGSIIAAAALICILFLVRAYREGAAMGMDKTVLRRILASGAAFSFLPSVGILLGVIALSGSLGTPWPWMQLSIIGALHYETQVAQAAAEQVGMSALTIGEMTPTNFTTILLILGLCIMGGMLLSLLFNEKYLGKVSIGTHKSQKGAGFGDKAMTAMFIGLVSAYIGSYVGGFVSGEGAFTFSGNIIPLFVAAVSAAAMGLFTYLEEKRNLPWLKSFSMAASMLMGMAAAVLAGQVL